MAHLNSFHNFLYISVRIAYVVAELRGGRSKQCFPCFLLQTPLTRTSAVKIANAHKKAPDGEDPQHWDTEHYWANRKVSVVDSDKHVPSYRTTVAAKHSFPSEAYHTQPNQDLALATETGAP